MPDGYFRRYGGVVELKAEKIDEPDEPLLHGKWALYASLAPTADLVSMVGAGQKVFTSMETRINIVPVPEMKGEKIGLDVSGTIASTTDTAGGDERETADFATLDAEGYFCQQVNYDFHIRYNTLDLWARYQDFQTRLRDAIVKRQALDRIMIGFNGTHRAKTSNRVKFPLLQDIAPGWLQKYRENAPGRVLDKIVGISERQAAVTGGRIDLPSGCVYTGMSGSNYNPSIWGAYSAVQVLINGTWATIGTV